MRPTVFGAPIGRQPSRSEHRRHSASGKLPTMQPPVLPSTSQHITVAQSVCTLLSTCWASVLGQAKTALTLHRLTVLIWTNAALTLHWPTAPSKLADTLFSTPSCKCARVSFINFNSTQYLYNPFQGPMHSQRGYHNIGIRLIVIYH